SKLWRSYMQKTDGVVRIGSIALVTAGLAMFLWQPARSQSGDVIKTKGREIANFCVETNENAILSRSTPEVVKALNGKLQEVLTSVKAQAPIGRRISESVNGSQYVAVHAFGAQQIVITVTFNGDGKMAGLFLSP